MNQTLEIAIAAATLLLNVSILLMNTKIRADIANVKVYMHEKFLTRKEFFYAMNPPTFHTDSIVHKPL